MTQSGLHVDREPGRRPAPFPVLSLGLGVLAIGLYLIPGAQETLAFERQAVLSGEVWRLLTSHWVHWSTDHLLWDVGTFVALGAACELRSRARLAACLVGSALVIGALVTWVLTDLTYYGGLSGIDCALFALLVAELCVEQHRAARPYVAVFALGLGLSLALKVGFEWATGYTLFVSNLGAGVSPVPVAHVAGAAVGVAVPAFAAWRRPRPVGS